MCKTKTITSIKEIKKIKKSANRLRHEFLLDREDKSESEKPKKEIRSIKKHE